MFWCCVNLPRWGLKPIKTALYEHQQRACVNLPRWGLKLSVRRSVNALPTVCKFTPLGFETFRQSLILFQPLRVNLPRWGLKRIMYQQKGVFLTV